MILQVFQTGQYAEEGLKALGAWSYVEKHASFGTNVTEVLEWVANASAEAGLVYATDAENQFKSSDCCGHA